MRGLADDIDGRTAKNDDAQLGSRLVELQTLIKEERVETLNEFKLK
jgi:hypothetical protein